MPYIITTSPASQQRRHCADTEVPRRAVATLDEARDYTFNARVNEDAQDEPLPADGGSIGPLPDGTTIEVAPVDWADLRRSLRRASATRPATRATP